MVTRDIHPRAPRSLTLTVSDHAPYRLTLSLWLVVALLLLDEVRSIGPADAYERSGAAGPSELAPSDD